MVQVSNLSFSYPNHKALDGVTFEIPQQSITALVGPNGAGKTTLLSCLATLNKPTDGSIIVDETDMIKNPLVGKSKIGFLIDFFGLYQDLTVKQCLHYFADAHKLRAAQKEESLDFTLRSINLEDRYYEKVSSLSRGMRQRLAIGQAIIHQPKLLLLDEPAAGLDPEARIQLASVFQALRDRGMTLIVSSHILAELDAYADNLIVLGDGKLVESNRLKQLGERKEAVLIEIEAIVPNYDDLIAFLQQQENVAAVNKKSTNIEVKFTGDREQQARLLQQIIQQGILINSFAAKEMNLQDQYLELIKK